mgnify:CR=1 FL=1|jgi:DNA polymerase
MRHYLGIDIETYSDENLKEVGVYKYVNSPNFMILLFAYAFDDEDVIVVDLASGEELPERVLRALTDKSVIKTAFNAQFERVCINKFYGLNTINWECTMIKSWSLGFPGSLDKVGEIIGLPQDQKKLWTGKNLIRIFSVPHKTTSKEQVSLMPHTYRVLPEDRPTEWEQFKEYCGQDVVTERAIRKKLNMFPEIPAENKLYQLDQAINDRGVMIDLQMAQAAIDIDTEQTNRLTSEYQEVTGLPNPNSLTDLKKFIKDKTGKSVSSITKNNMQELQEKAKDYPDILRALEIRQMLSKTSISKYKKMLEVTCDDDRARGLLQFYGASNTGRWAGRLIQVQNLPQNHIKDLDTARKIVKTGDLDFLEMMYDNPSDILSQCIRPAIIPRPGYKFAVADFSAIEARVIAWFAGEKWRLDVFKGHGKIYEASAAQMFKVPIESIHKGDSLRQKGKIAELALGYQGGKGALISMGALKMGLNESELPELVNQWRASNTKIVKFWYDTEAAVIEAVENRTTVKIKNNLKAIYKSGMLFLELPSGRRLAYVKPKIVDHDKFMGKKKIIFQGVDSKTYQWKDSDTYGGKLVENIVQATARDCLAHSMLKLDEAGYKIVMHVHDEVIIEIEKDRNELETITEIMGQEIPWARGLPLRADGYECEYYQKD